MGETSTDKPSEFLGNALVRAIRQAVQEGIKELKGELNGHSELLTPEELAERLKVPLTWVYEQSRQGNIPTHRIGRYIRFDFHEVVESQKNH